MSRNEATFSKSYIESLKPSPDGNRLYYYDTKVRGLELYVTPAGGKTFCVYKWANGRPRRVQLGHYDGRALQGLDFNENPLVVLGNNPGLTVEHARQLAQAVLLQLATGDKPRHIKRKEEAADITLEQLFDMYIDRYAMEHTKTWQVMQECFKRYLSEWKNRPVKEITRGDVQLLVNRLGKKSGKTTANRTLELLKAIINKGKRWSLVQGENPATGITKFKLKSRERFVTDNELPKLMAAIQAEPNDAIRDYVLLSLSTGARKTNVLSMRWEQVDLNQGIWMIPDTKNGTSQTILLTQDELAILKKRFDTRKGFEWVFPGPSTSKHLKDPKKGWMRILEAAGIKDLHLHDLRRTLGSYMAMTGASLSVIGNALNHKDVSTTRRVYAQSAREAEKLARERAHEKMFKQEEKPADSNVVEMPKKDSIEF
jgi:integrase